MGKVKKGNSKMSGPGNKNGNPQNLKAGKRRMTAMQHAFVSEYLLCGNAKEAARKAGYRNPTAQGVMLLDPARHPLTANAVAKARARQEQRAEMKADDVLRHIHEVIQINLAEWFLPGDGGGWLIDEADLAGLPPYVGKMIESIERRETVLVTPDGNEVRKVQFWVRIVSKTKAMELAAKHQLGEKHEYTFTQVNWDEMYRRRPRPDPLARRLEVLAEEVKALPPTDTPTEDPK